MKTIIILLACIACLVGCKKEVFNTQDKPIEEDWIYFNGDFSLGCLCGSTTTINGNGAFTLGVDSFGYIIEVPLK